MAGIPQNNAPGPLAQTPYGHQAPQIPMPAYDPRAGRRPGGTACKVWGVLLLVFGVITALNLVANLVMVLTGVSSGAMTPGLSEEATQIIEEMQKQLVTEMLGRPTFWINLAGESINVTLSLMAAVFLLFKPRPRGAKFAVMSAVVVLLLLPVAAYEGIKVAEVSIASTDAMMDAQFRDAARKGAKVGPPPGFQDTFGQVMRGATFGAMILSVIVRLIINGLLAFQMTRPAVKDYLASAQGDQSTIPGYDPSMGMMMSPPGASLPQPPMQQPPGPPPPAM